MIAGDTVAITLAVAEYQAPTWALTWALSGPAVLSVSSVDNGADHDLNLTAVQTAALGEGLYQWRLRATDGTEVRTIARGTLTVEADLALHTAGDATPFEYAMRTALRSSLSGSIDANMADFMIDGRRVIEIPLAERVKLLSWVESRIAVMEGAGFGSAVRMGFRSVMAGT